MERKARVPNGSTLEKDGVKGVVINYLKPYYHCALVDGTRFEMEGWELRPLIVAQPPPEEPTEKRGLGLKSATKLIVMTNILKRAPGTPRYEAGQPLLRDGVTGTITAVSEKGRIYTTSWADYSVEDIAEEDIKNFIHREKKRRKAIKVGARVKKEGRKGVVTACTWHCQACRGQAC